MVLADVLFEVFFFFFNDTATTEIYTLSLHDALPISVRGPQASTLSVVGVGPDGVPGTPDDVGTLKPGEQGQAEFLLRGDHEGYQNLSFDVAATLDGLVTGPIKVTGKAQGGVLVRNPFFDMTFT